MEVQKEVQNEVITWLKGAREFAETQAPALAAAILADARLMAIYEIAFGACFTVFWLLTFPKDFGASAPLPTDTVDRILHHPPVHLFLASLFGWVALAIAWLVVIFDGIPTLLRLKYARALVVASYFKRLT